ncbi:hypothetical protein H6P81_018402 [Aristolochia fimbriata]|uniref:Inner membrane localized protein n=1 Tax=Aristolochia fimbriata TaxID=158543 RepID=A0AAV7E583_ARIFI|nr:hypothetical protein H6P81_018402 [Aristolochia fimbriata]
MAALSQSLVFSRDLKIPAFSGSSLKPLDNCKVKFRPIDLSVSQVNHRSAAKRKFTIRAGANSGRPSSASIFVGGFVLGGIIVGTLGCVYAPQISKALAGADRKDLMRKLPKFIYDEEKALERTRKILAEKIAQLNDAIDDVSSQLRADDTPNGAAVASDEVEAAV